MRVILVLGLFACTASADRSPGPTDHALASGLGFGDSVIRTLSGAARGGFSPLSPEDSVGNPSPAVGLAFAVPTGRTAKVLGDLRARLGAEYLVFEIDRGFGQGPDSVGVIRSRDTLDMMRSRNTNGTNYDVSTDSVIALVRGWQRRYGLRLHAAGLDWLEGTVRIPADQWPALAREVAAACPDVVEQGTSTVEALEAEMRKSGLLYCWWD